MLRATKEVAPRANAGRGLKRYMSFKHYKTVVSPRVRTRGAD